MTREEFINEYTSENNKLIIGIKTAQNLNYLLHILAKLEIELPSAHIMSGLRNGLSMNNRVGLLLRHSFYRDYLPEWSYSNNVDNPGLRDFNIKWFDAVQTDVLEGDKL